MKIALRRVLCLLSFLLIAGCSNEQPSENKVTSIEELATFVDQNPAFKGEANSVPVPVTMDPNEKEMPGTLDIGK